MAYIFEVHRLAVFLFSFFAGVLVYLFSVEFFFLFFCLLFSFSLYAIIRDGLCQAHTNSINYYCEEAYEVNGNSVYIYNYIKNENHLKN